MIENFGRNCDGCGHRLFDPQDAVFAGTVFAADTHDCARVTKVVGEARRGAALFARIPEFHHARLITPGLTPRAWTEVLQTETTAVDLQHVILDIDGGHPDREPAKGDLVVVVSTRVGHRPDVQAVLRELSDRLRQAT